MSSARRLPIAAVQRRAGEIPPLATLERLSIELTRACTKACSFCYNGSHSRGETVWTADEVARLVESCLPAGLRSVSFGGGEPLQFAGLFELLRRLRGRCFRSMTSNGLLLEQHWDDLTAAAPDKVHLSVHFPDDEEEVERVGRQARELEAAGIRSGVNLLVSRSRLGAARRAVQRLAAFDVSSERLLLLPQRKVDSPSAAELVTVAGSPRFQSVTCLTRCSASPRFASLDWERRVGWCSYTNSRARLAESSFAGLVVALQGLGLESCLEQTDHQASGKR